MPYHKISDFMPPRTCLECRYYHDRIIVTKPFWGKVPRTSYCARKDEIVVPSDAPDCKLFLEKTFRSDNE